MNILHLLSKNLGRGSRTITPANILPYPADFRGEIEHEMANCITCGMCVYTCSPGAITITAEGKYTEVWKYTEDRCTFCGRCVEYCPTQALHFKQAAPAPLTERPQHYLVHTIELKECEQCGEPVHVIPDSILAKLYREDQIDNVHPIFNLCEKCRQIPVVEQFRETVKEIRGNYDE